MNKTEIIGTVRSGMFQKRITQNEMASDLNIGRVTLCKKFKSGQFTLDQMLTMCEKAGYEMIVIPKEV